ncbi:phosphomannomutase/phosphoglucomutase [Nocardiopsis changdeensis]|uniref:Phosphomannomutase/phosphoglucomutase n=1 Tax=Nocardiopsis changdeensis TaxID=2831969 RepID=A0ABX8BNK6_9ACTN|nr:MULTISPECIES: phosphomannomutase/phosphoglucomutase [Nocardiopsis]QUX23825.1 phosphomannomutase/phosphoglucomutase [Nocardiopsis changdeensis]QYX39770.1 phosphomannomutase/phosphoglucomutase [Nocardiopsis sp. MT53]
MADLAGIFKAYDVRGVIPDTLDADISRAIGAAFARTVGGPAVVVAHDMRPSSPELARAFADGVTSQGVDVVFAGLGSTDLLYYGSGALDLPGAMFTASHNPAQYNGIKMCRAGAAPISAETGLAEIRRLAEEGVPAHDGPAGTVTEKDLLAGYADHLRTLVDLSGIRPLKVVVDAGNGMGGHTVPAVLEQGLPLEIVPLYFELDGTFPNHPANPLDPANIVDLQKKVRETGADIGLAFDGDADRCFVVDENGDAVPPSAITALVAVQELARDPGATVIHNLITSHAVPEIVREHGGVPVRTRVGHSYIKATMAETGAVFGGEHSAHYYFRDFWKADTGMLAAMHVLRVLGSDERPLSEITAEYSRYAASGEINSEVADAADRTAAVRDAFAGREGAEVDELDGLTVTLPDGSWFNLRASNTEPLLRLNVEAPDAAAVDALRDEVLAIVRS